MAEKATQGQQHALQAQHKAIMHTEGCLGATAEGIERCGVRGAQLVCHSVAAKR